jgi:hypothetical protein
LAYFLNQKLPILLSKSSSFVESQSTSGVAFFSKFSYLVNETQEEWHLIENKDEIIVASNAASNDLFSNEAQSISTNVYLLPEMKKVNFFLKIENTFITISEIVSRLNSINHISTAYAVEIENLKSKNNLIF